MRTFIAVPLPEPCRDLLDKMQGELRSFGAEVGWVAIPSIHLTLKFLGEVDPSILPKMAEGLQAAVALENGFDVCIRGLGCFPNPRNPRVIWCGLDCEQDSLSRIQRIVETTCESYGFPPEDREFKPHLTLGRVKGKRNLQPLIDCIKIGSDLECTFRANHFNIYRSTLHPKGAVYTVLNTVRLRE